MIVNDVSELIGNTPMIRIKGISDDTRNVNVYGKLEMFNPGCSIKDRSAFQLLEAARLEGKLKPGYSIVESSSGNMGHALAMLCAQYGYNFTCVLDPKTPKDNISLIKVFGGEVRMVVEPDNTGSYQKKRIALAKSLAESIPNCINLDQYNNPAAIEAHSRHTGPESYSQLNGKVDIIIGSVSTGSHLSGIAEYIKGQSPTTQVIGVEPQGSVFFGGVYIPFLQNGIGLSFIPENYRNEYVDTRLKVSDQDAFSYCHKLAREEGLLLGGSSGSVASVAHQYAKTCTPSTNIVMLCADTGLKYLNTIYDFEWLTNNDVQINHDETNTNITIQT